MLIGGRIPRLSRAARRPRRGVRRLPPPQRGTTSPQQPLAPANPPSANPAGAHALTDPVASWFVRQARVSADELMLDTGAGLGASTRPLLASGTRVIAMSGSRPGSSGAPPVPAGSP